VAKLLLINPSYYRTYGSNEGGLGNPIYPVMALACLAATARHAGHEVKIVDMSYRKYDPHFIRSMLRAEQPDVLGITATTPLANQMRDISYIAKEVSADILTIGGGAHASAFPDETLRQSALDLVAFGEADWTIVDVLDGLPHSEIAGVCYRDGDIIQTGEPRQMLADLDSLPIPAWDLYPIEDYKSHTSRLVVKNRPASTIEFSRGCVYKCDFCASKNTMGLGYRKKSPARCADEMEVLYRLGYREVVLADDIFTSDNHWAAEVCEEIIRRDIKMSWTCSNGIRVDSANSELFRVMKRAGCYRVHFGFESGNDGVLQAFGKGGKATLEQGVEAVETARAAGLDTFGMFMLGLSADTESTMQDTINYAKRVKVDAMRFGITVPIPGTPMFNELMRQKRIKSFDWDDYTVYNDAHQIYDHPNLAWSTINEYYRRSNVEAYLKNPGYMWRRFARGVRTGEFFWDAYYFFAFLKTMRKHVSTQNESYAYRDRWDAQGFDAECVADISLQRTGTGTSWSRESV